ncbi:GNAT family N-acetyltransferase [Pseudanabaena sp. FACHB-2040]|uniref:GNAT family N-acetyltransferase n=1 Tax=Pseudanabaena sp. FACHB-2040 TaxID=2692859 RepID=UPI001A7E623E|nr:GNAT family N-acetyltransferase [Pseudanabaena sp. FACHB-2040]
MKLSAEDLAHEDQALHFGLFTADDLIACVVAIALDSSTTKLRQMAVAPEYQGQGCGRALLKQVEAILRQQGVRLVTLHARKTATAFYEKLGYQVEGSEFIEVTLPHYRMRKELETLSR